MHNNDFICRQRNMRKIGIILDSTTEWGGSFQYSGSILDAVYSYSEMVELQIVAFVMHEEWKRYLGNNSVIIKSLTGQFVQDNLIIDDEGCDLIISTGQSGWSGRLHSDTVEPVHDLMHIYESGFPEVGNPFEIKKRNQIFKSIVYNAKAVLVDSEIGKKHVKEVFGTIYEDKIHIQPFAVPGYIFKPSKNVAIPFSKYFFYPAQFWKHKNHSSLVKAAIILRSEGIRVNFVFAGSTLKNGYAEVAELIRKNSIDDQFCILGYVPNENMRFLFENARALVMPTFFGPTNIPPMEAAVLGCPSAVSNIYGMLDQLRECALYFDPCNIEEMASVLKRLWLEDSLCERLGNDAKRRSRLFTQEAFNKSFKVLLDQLLSTEDKEKSLLFRLLRFCHTHNRIYLYGAGEYAFIIYGKLLYYNVFVEEIIVSDVSSNKGAERAFNKRLTDVNDLDLKEGDGVICAMGEKNHKQIGDVLTQKGVLLHNTFFVTEELFQICKAA